METRPITRTEPGRDAAAVRTQALMPALVGGLIVLVGLLAFLFGDRAVEGAPDVEVTGSTQTVVPPPAPAGPGVITTPQRP